MGSNNKAKPIPVTDREALVRRLEAGSRPSERGCRLWVGWKDKYGYGHMRIGGSVFLSHRVAYQVHVASADDLYICHHCDTPSCIEPTHLFGGTLGDNNRDCTAKGRRPRGDANAARLYPERLSRGDRHWTRTNPEKVPRGDKNGARLHPERLYRGPRPWVKGGEEHGRALVTEEDVRTIRRLVAAKEATQQALAARYGVSRGTISAIVTRQNWKHVA
jgi:predicted DNA-binding protein (UPF0251 family)